MKFFRPQHLEQVVENVIKQYLTIAFWISPFAFWKLYEIVKQLMT